MLNYISSTGILGGLAKTNSKKIVAGITLILTTTLAVALTVPATAATVVVNAYTVRPNDVRPISELATGPAGWYEESVGTGNVELTSTRPYNTGSAEFTVGDPASYVELGLYKHLPSYRLADQTSIPYATWQQVDNSKAVSLQIGLDTDVTDSDTTWQGRMVYEPYLNTDFGGNPVTDGVWQTWKTNSPASQWWMTWSASLTTKYGANPCPQSDPCDYSHILGLFPNAGFNEGFGNPLILKAGSGWTSFTGFADVPALGTAEFQEFWDFEPALVTPPPATLPTSKDQCKRSGWQNFGTTFKNQGECVAFLSKKQ